LYATLFYPNLLNVLPISSPSVQLCICP